MSFPEKEESIKTNTEWQKVVPYDEPVVTVKDWASTTFAHPGEKTKNYFQSLFPIIKWLPHYNLKWLYGDLIAGITVGCVLVPQSMSYAQLAGLSPEFGLYSSFVGVFVYSLFATSKDVSIGPVAVMSMQVSKVISEVEEKGGNFSPEVIATVLALICGAIAAGMGILRLGFILEYIPVPAVMGFMTGSALSIISGQVPALMGYNSSVNTRQATYMVIIETLKNLPKTSVDAAFGLVPLFILYFIKFATDWGMRRYPHKKLWFFYFQVMRNALVIVFATLICWGCFRIYGDHPIKTIGLVPSGLKHVGVMEFPSGIVDHMAGEIPVSVIILLLEHISIAKSFGRVNDYKINPDQELVAIGVNNLVGTFFMAYPSTGSFSRSALKSKCGVRTPLAGIFTGGVVLLALYCFTDAFYYIPKATLSAIIIHAVSDLIASYKHSLNFWRIAPLDAFIFVVAVILSVFHSIETGIYFAMCASAAVLLWRVSMPNGVFLGRVRVAQVPQSPLSFVTRWVPLPQKVSPLSQPFTHAPLINSEITVTPPPAGVVVFRPSESFSYPNASKQIDIILDEVKRTTRRGNAVLYKSKSDRPWNDPGELTWSLPNFRNIFRRNKADISDVSDTSVDEPQDPRPLLKILHLDFASVTAIDSTGVQALMDLRKGLYLYTAADVEFHFSGILSPWIRRALIAGGFGSESTLDEEEFKARYVYVGKTYKSIRDKTDVFAQEETEIDALPAITGSNTPFFHFDIPAYEEYDL